MHRSSKSRRNNFESCTMLFLLIMRAAQGCGPRRVSCLSIPWRELRHAADCWRSTLRCPTGGPLAQAQAESQGSTSLNARHPVSFSLRVDPSHDWLHQQKIQLVHFGGRKNTHQNKFIRSSVFTGRSAGRSPSLSSPSLQREAKCL